MMSFIFWNVVALLCALASPVYAPWVGALDVESRSLASLVLFVSLILLSLLAELFLRNETPASIGFFLSMPAGFFWLMPMTHGGPNFAIWLAARIFG